MAKITPKTTDLFVGTTLKVINIKENTPFILNKFYNITDGDGVGALFVGGYSDVELSMHELGDYFEHIASLDDIENLESKCMLLKQVYNDFKQLSEEADENKTQDALINETIAFLAQDEVYQCDEIELRFICDNMDITMVEQCSCCGDVLMPDDEAYEDDLNDGVALCDHCSEFDEGRNMYIKSVHQDVIEKLTGYKFSPHLGNVGSKIEEFNYWLNKYNHKFGFKESNNKEILIEFINEYTEWNICDCCSLIEKSTDLVWKEDINCLLDSEYIAMNFINSTVNVDSICKNCLNMFIARTKLPLHTIVERIKENKMVYRVGDLVVLENVNFDEENTSSKTYIDYIVSIDENKKSYKLKEYGDVEFKEEDFYDIANEAYVNEYIKFIANKYPKLSESVIHLSEENNNIESILTDFGYKNEFIEQLKADNLPYGRLLTPKFKIGDTFSVHFDYYDEGEFTTHQIVKIDKSFTEADEIVYWDNNYVYITESELEKQKALLNKEFDEVMIVKNELLQYIFCEDDDFDIVIPTFQELTEVEDYQSNWKLSEEYGDYSLSSLIYIVNEQSTKFFSIQKILNNQKEKLQKSKKYGFRQRVEFGSPIELVLELQEIFNIYAHGLANPENELVLMQDCRNTEDYSSIEIILQTAIKFDELSFHLKSTLDKEHHAEVDMLLEAIKEAKADKQETLLVYDC